LRIGLPTQREVILAINSVIRGAKLTHRLRGAFRTVRLARVVSISFDCLKRKSVHVRAGAGPTHTGMVTPSGVRKAFNKLAA
jgi:hypothetical protein